MNDVPRLPDSAPPATPAGPTTPPPPAAPAAPSATPMVAEPPEDPAADPVVPSAADVGPALPGVGGFAVSQVAVGADAMVPPPPAAGSVTVSPPAPGVIAATADRPPPDPRGLYSIGWLRTIWLGLNAAALPLMFLDLLLGAAAVVAAYLIVIIWSGLAVANASRAKPALSLRHQSPPGVVSVVVKWLSPIALGLVGSVAFGAMSVWVDDAPSADQGGRAIALVFAALVFLVVLVVMVYLPYGHLARATAWVGGDGGRMRRWFFAPIVAALIGSTIRFFLFIGIVTDDSGSHTTVYLAIMGLTAGLPWVVWLIFGNRGMIELETACEMTYERALNPHGSFDASQINPVVAGQGLSPVAPNSAPPSVVAPVPPPPPSSIPSPAVSPQPTVTSPAVSSSVPPPPPPPTP